jgi:hypothetical protein
VKGELQFKWFGWGLAVARQKKRSRRGGAREGAGRKPTLKDRAGLSVQLDGDAFDRLAAIAEEREVSMGSLVREAIAQYLTIRRKR